MIGVLGICAGSVQVLGGTHAPLQYHGGPILRTFKIYPLYYGNWSSADVTAQQNYLTGLTAYLSGKGQQAGQQPMLWQYGVNEASVAPATKAGSGAKPTKTPLTKTDLLNIIHTSQSKPKGGLPAFGPATLIIVFPAHGFSVDFCNSAPACHK